MLTTFLHDAFRRFSAAAEHADAARDADLQVSVHKAVEHVVDETYSRLRLIPGYAQRLYDPVRTAFGYIDAMVDEMPPALRCAHDTFVSDPRVNAFFASPAQLQEAFSQSHEVRSLFETHPEVDECWALLCMHKEERRQFGMTLAGDEVRKEVMQTGVSFSDHQLVSPGVNETDARHALKCCIFNSLLGYIRRRASAVKQQTLELEHRRKQLKGRLAAKLGGLAGTDISRQVDEIEKSLAGESLRLLTLDDHLSFIVQVLGHPEQFVSRGVQQMRLSRMGVKIDDTSTDPGYELTLSEIQVACHGPRIAALVRFPRKELLPKQDYLKKADLFLAM